MYFCSLPVDTLRNLGVKAFPHSPKSTFSWGLEIDFNDRDNVTVYLGSKDVTDDFFNKYYNMYSKGELLAINNASWGLEIEVMFPVLELYVNLQ